MPIPARLTQTHRSEDLARASRDSWLAHNPGFEYVFFDHDARRRFMAERFADLLPTHDRLPHWAQQADLFRYAVMYAEGGVYSDADTLCCASLDEYINRQQDTLVIGVEMSPDQYTAGIDAYIRDYPIPHQFLNWTLATSPGHPVFAALLKRIAWHTSLMTDEQLVRYSRNDKFTLQMTGPLLFTQVCNEFLCGNLQGAIQVLPRQVWGSWPSEQGLPGLQGQIKVKHLFEGAWKNRPAQTGVRYAFKL